LSWKAGWDMFLDNPLGVGGNNFPMRFPEYQSKEFKKNMWGRAAHSLWFTLIPELGVFGILIYLLLLRYNLKDVLLLKNVNNKEDADLRYIYLIAISTLASLAGFFASATFLSVLYYPHYWYVTALIVATKRIAANLKADKEANSLCLSPD
jgi:hypothetical protein